MTLTKSRARLQQVDALQQIGSNMPHGHKSDRITGSLGGRRLETLQSSETLGLMCSHHFP